MHGLDDGELLPGQDNRNSRYYVDKISNMYGVDKWCVFDLNIVPAEPVKDERTDSGTGKKKHQRFWKGSYEDAIHYCGLLNKAYVERGERAATLLDSLSKSQRIHYANNAARRRTAVGVHRSTVGRGETGAGAGGLAGFSNPFTKCDGCGRMVREGHTC